MKHIKALLGAITLSFGLLTTGYAINCPDAAAIKSVGFTKFDIEYIVSSAVTVDHFNTDRLWGFSTFLTQDEGKAPTQELLSKLNKSLADLQYFDKANEKPNAIYCFYHFNHGQREAIAITRV